MLRIMNGLVGLGMVLGFGSLLTLEGGRINETGWVVSLSAIAGGIFVLSFSYLSRPSSKVGLVRVWMHLKRAEMLNKIDGLESGRASDDQKAGRP